MGLNSSLSGSSHGNVFHQLLLCFYTQERIHNGMLFLSVNALVILPICSSVLYLGFQQLRLLSKISHSDAFTYHVSAIQIIGCLTCGERYIAVVHPMTYLGLKKRTMTSNVICGLVWLQLRSSDINTHF
uniref:G-protein coupled receptors family 1 profile domain-containing protein n=1 Tax=Knipowitschia caucasica TaxID=637954 RepID=A0AAV2KLQ9_KNICA